MNTYALALIIVATPLVGVTLSLPGDGLIGFAAAAGLCLLAGLFLPPQALLEPPTSGTVSTTDRVRGSITETLSPKMFVT